MSTYRELTYLVLDELKLISDDSYFTQDHVLFLLSKVRSFLLQQKYKKDNQNISTSNYQTLCLDLEQIPAIDGIPCNGGIYLKSTQKIPALMNISNTQLYPMDYYQGNITYVSRERMRFVGHNKWLKNIIYASIGPDDYLYMKSDNPQYLHLEQVKVSGIFEDPDKAAELQCEDEQENNCDILDKKYPIEEELIPQVVEVVVKYLSGSIYKPSDPTNNANDDLSSIVQFIRTNMKSNLQKQIEGE